MKEKVLNQSIFLYTCPNCGATFRLNYPTLYHQMEALVMIYLVPESEVEKTYEMFYGENALADYRTEKYLYRRMFLILRPMFVGNKFMNN